MSIAVPLNITSKRLAREENLRKSIDQSLSLLINTPCFSCSADPQYGFIFKNMRFEIINENDGVIFNSTESLSIFDGPEGLYSKKITGSSRNLNTFATELKEAIIRYEKRLSDISVTMTYIHEEKLIYVSINGIISETMENYQYKSTINIWK